MIRVTIAINEDIIADVHAVRVKGHPGQQCTYKVTQEGLGLLGFITHDYDEGAVALSQRLLGMWRKDVK